ERVDSRQVEYSPHHGASPGDEHPAIRLGAEQDRQAATACPADLSAECRRPGDRLCGISSTTGDVGWIFDRESDPGEQDRPRMAGPLPREGGLCGPAESRARTPRRARQLVRDCKGSVLFPWAL